MLKPPLLPIEIFYDHPLVRVMPEQARGLYYELILSFWRTGEPLPDKETSLAARAGANPAQWQRHRDIVLRALNDSMPKITKVYEKRMTTYQRQLKHALDMVDNRIKQASKKYDIQRSITDVSTTLLPNKSQKAVPFHNPQADIPMLSALKKRPVSAGSMTDKPTKTGGK